MSSIRSRLFGLLLLTASGSLWAQRLPQCGLVSTCDGGNGGLSSVPGAICRATQAAISQVCATAPSPLDVVNQAMTIIGGYAPKCVSGSSSSTQGGYTVTSTARVCLNPAPAGPNMIFACTASAGSPSVNVHVDCGPARVPTDTRDPVPGYGADTNNAVIYGLMQGKTLLNVRFSGITSGNSTQGAYTLDVSPLLQ